MIDRDAILEKIRKLIALAGNNPDPAEAALAAGNARSLMLEHDLAEADLGKIAGDVRSEYVGEKKEWPVWQSMLFTAVGEHLNCRPLVERAGWADRLILVGRSSDIQVAQYLFTFLLRQVAGLGNKYKHLHPRMKWASIREYYVGVVSAIAAKFADEKRGDERLHSEPGTALVLAKDAAIDEFLKREGWTITRRGQYKSCSRNKMALLEGMLAGSQIDIRAGVAGDGRNAGVLNG
jgi:hypothetical protein